LAKSKIPPERVATLGKVCQSIGDCVELFCFHDQNREKGGNYTANPQVAFPVTEPIVQAWPEDLHIWNTPNCHKGTIDEKMELVLQLRSIHDWAY
jgi:hypothetical protein